MDAKLVKWANGFGIVRRTTDEFGDHTYTAWGISWARFGIPRPIDFERSPGSACLTIADRLAFWRADNWDYADAFDESERY